MPPKTTPSPKKRATPKSDEARKFLRDYLADGRKSSAEVREEASKRGINWDTLLDVSQIIAEKIPAMGPEGRLVWYWTLCAPRARPRKSKAAFREDSIEFISRYKQEGYKQAINEILVLLARIDGEKGKKKTAEHVIARCYEELRTLKDLAC